MDVNLVVRNPKAIDEAIESLWETDLVLKVVEGLQDYLSWKVRFSSNNNRAC